MFKHLDDQPKGLYSLFFTELWERFGFYTVQAILILYMTRGLGYSDKHSYLLYGTFNSLIYLTPVLGGYLADRFLGFKRSILFGGALLMIGYALMAIRSIDAFFLGMAVIVVANGLFKPNVSSMVGDLYTRDDPKRDSGYTLFYMGINIGAMLPPIFIGWLVNAFGWNFGFLVASIGMGIGFVTFLTQQKRLANIGKPAASSPLHFAKKRALSYIIFFAGILLFIAVLQFLFASPQETNYILIASAVLILSAVFYYLVKEPLEQRRKLLACLMLIVVSVGFWAIYVQMFTSAMLFADRNMSKSFLGFTIDAEFTQFFNPFFILVLSPILSFAWVHLAHKHKNPSTPIKFAFGILFMSIGFFVLGAGTQFFSTQGMASAWWLVCSYFIMTVGELFLSPIGLSMITRLAPKHLVGMMMGVWFLTQSAAFAIGSLLAIWADVPVGIAPNQSLPIYSRAFLGYGAVAFSLAIVAFLLAPYVNRLIHEPSGVNKPPTA